MIETEKFQKIEVKSQDELRSWLSTHFEQKESVWLVTWKKDTPEKYVSTGQVLDELLCYGWIDGIRRKLDEKKTMQLISPRKTQHWTKTYKDRVAKLIEKGLMQPSGLKAIEVSKQNGLWNLMDDVDALVVPEDLQQALNINPAAASFFTSSNPSSKRFVLRWLKLTKTEKTRTSRIEKIVQLSAMGMKIPGS